MPKYEVLIDGKATGLVTKKKALSQHNLQQLFKGRTARSINVTYRRIRDEKK